MKEIDTITINDGKKNKEIYPLAEIERNNKKIIFYLEEIKASFNKEDVFIGEITTNNELIPVSENILKEAEKFLNELIEKINKK